MMIDIMGITAKTNAITFKPIGEINFDLFLGFTNSKRRDR
tara:strand:- start:451 stop:570 length:120 start_codon:yes stop_codon:yes gene_type:complete